MEALFPLLRLSARAQQGRFWVRPARYGKASPDPGRTGAREEPPCVGSPRPLRSLERPEPGPADRSTFGPAVHRARAPICGFRTGWEGAVADEPVRSAARGSSFSGSWDRRLRPETNSTAARSCDCTAVSDDWLPPRVSASLLLPSAPTPAPKLRANETAPYRRPPSASSAPRLGEGGDVLTGRMSSEAPFPSPITERSTLPAEFSSQLRSDRG